MAYVRFGRSQTLAQAKASDNVNKIFFPTDSTSIVLGGKEYGGEDGVDPVEVKSMTAIVPNGFTDGLAALTRLRGNTIKWNQLIPTHEHCTLNGFTYSNGEYTSNLVTAGITYFSSIVKPNNNYQGKVAPTHKIYYRIELRTDNSQITTAKLFIFYDNDDFNVATLRNVGTTYKTFSNIETLPSSAINHIEEIQIRWQNFGTAPSDFHYILKDDIEITDLTAIFGEGNEPTSVEEVEAYLAQLGNVNLPYSEGTITPVKMTGVKSVGFNIWDEELLHNYSIDSSNGIAYPNTGVMCSKNFIRVFAGQTYYIKVPTKYTSYINFRLYDANKNYIGYSLSAPNSTYIIPSGVSYIKFNINEQTYTNDICINISDANRNGTYEPYNEGTTNFNVTQLRGKLNGVGSLVYPFANGMNGFNNIFDEVKIENGQFIGVKRWGRYVFPDNFPWTLSDSTNKIFTHEVSFDTKNGKTLLVSVNNKYQSFAGGAWGWTSCPDKALGFYLMANQASADAEHSMVVHDTSCSTVAEMKAATAGVELIYELATPEYYILEEPDGILPNIPVEEGGVISVLPDNTDEIVTAAPLMDIRWRAVAADVAKSVAWDNITGKPNLDLDREVIAEAFLQLRTDIDGLKKRLDEAPKWVDADYGYTIKGQKMFDLTSGAPDYVPLSKGLIRMDASTGHVWVSIAVTNSTSDWKQIA